MKKWLNALDIALFCSVVIGSLWQKFELQLYGAVQARKVDDLVAICYFTGIALAYLIGVDDGRKDGTL